MKTKRLMKVRKAMKKALRKIKYIALVPVLAAGLVLAAPAKANAGSLELMTGNNKITMDLKAGTNITKKLGIFTRIRPSVDYKGNMDNFGLVDLSINLVGNLDAVTEFQVIGGTVIPRQGLQYYTSIGDLSVFTMLTAGLTSDPYLESLTLLKYNPILYKKLKLLVQAENITDIGANGHLFSTQRLRLGTEIHGWSISLAADLVQIGNHPKSSDGTLKYTLGGAVSKSF